MDSPGQAGSRSSSSRDYGNFEFLRGPPALYAEKAMFLRGRPNPASCYQRTTILRRKFIVAHWIVKWSYRSLLHDCNRR